MLKYLLALIALVIVAVFAHDHSRSISESHVRDHYQGQLQAFRSFDEEKICGNAADDFEVKVVQTVDGRSENSSLDAYTACEKARKLIRLAQLMSEQTRGLATLEVSQKIESIEVSPDGRSATVKSVSTIKVGDMLMARTRDTERLSRSFWRTLSHGGESRVWAYAG